MQSTAASWVYAQRVSFQLGKIELEAGRYRQALSERASCGIRTLRAYARHTAGQQEAKKE
jgi:hypothetical protein